MRPMIRRNAEHYTLAGIASDEGYHRQNRSSHLPKTVTAGRVVPRQISVGLRNKKLEAWMRRCRGYRPQVIFLVFRNISTILAVSMMRRLPLEFITSEGT